MRDVINEMLLDYIVIDIIVEFSLAHLTYMCQCEEINYGNLIF